MRAKIKKDLLAVFTLVFFITCSFLTQECLSQASSRPQQMMSDEEEAEMIEDLDKKIDKTVRVLDVIKGELEDYKEEKAAVAASRKTASGAGEETSLADRFRGKIKTAIRIWKKVRKVVEEETQAPRTGSYTTEPEPAWTKDLDRKLDQAIETMEVIRAELKEVEEE